MERLGSLGFFALDAEANRSQAFTTGSLLEAALQCFGWLVLYIVGAALFLVIVHLTMRLPRELFRKMLHLAAVSSAIVIVETAGHWLAAALASSFFALIVYPALMLLEHWQGYGDLFVQRRSGEVKRSLLLLYFMIAGIIVVFWGGLGQSYIVIAAILMWGLGDAAAALVGTRFGRHHVRLRYADPKKTWEGSTAMMLTACLVGFIALRLTTALSCPACLLTAAITATAAALAELFTHKGYDTVSVPVVAATTLYLLSFVV